MALDATVGGAEANSYATNSDADDYFADRLHATAWTDASESDQDAALIMATRGIDALCYRGTAGSSTQALQFPRTGLKLPTGYSTTADAIPRLIKEATYEYALVLLNSAADATLEREQVTEGLKELKAGPVTLKFRDDFDYRALPGNVRAMIPELWLCDTEERRYVFAAM